MKLLTIISILLSVYSCEKQPIEQPLDCFRGECVLMADGKPLIKFSRPDTSGNRTVIIYKGTFESNTSFILKP